MKALLRNRLALGVAALNCLGFPLLAAANKPPVANNDSYSVNANTTLTVQAPGNHPPAVSDFSGIFLANGTEQQFTFCASDADGDPLTFRTIQPPSHGTA